MGKNRVMGKKIVPWDDDKKRTQEMRSRFEKHEVTRFEYVYTGGVELMYIKFQQPGFDKALMVEIIYKDNRVLYFDGDWNHATYALSDPAPITRFKDMNMGYFNGKCKASGEFHKVEDSYMHLVALQEAMKWLDENQPGWLS